MLTEEKAQEAMQIILHAGDARLHCTNALKHLESDAIEEAQAEMKLANQEIIKAHKLQTNAISSETKGEEAIYSVLFAHAQDTLMTVYSELNITKRLLRIFEHHIQKYTSLEERINKLEQGELK